MIQKPHTTPLHCEPPAAATQHTKFSRAKLLCALAAVALAPLPALAQLISRAQVNVYTAALATGEASSPLPELGPAARAIQALKTMARDDGPIYIEAKRVVRFIQQPKCGRVAFQITQPSSGKAWADLGGQMNICEDGTPPLRVCKADPAKLVMADSRCPDLSMPQDTPEIEQAIRQAVAAGQQTGAQITQQLLRQKAAK